MNDDVILENAIIIFKLYILTDIIFTPLNVSTLAPRNETVADL